MGEDHINQIAGIHFASRDRYGTRLMRQETRTYICGQRSTLNPMGKLLVGPTKATLRCGVGNDDRLTSGYRQRLAEAHRLPAGG